MFRRRASEAKHAATDSGGGQAARPAAHREAREDPAPRRPSPSPGPDVHAGRGAASPYGPAPAGLDVSAPHPARVWNYWLGGRDFFAADKAAGEEIGREFPHLAEMARAERAFLVRAVRFLAGPARIRQFLDVGAGLPAGGNTHELAQRIAPESRISYADADLRDVAAVLAGAASTLDLSKPVALILLGILGHVDDYGVARSIASQLMEALPAGSYLVIADGTACDQETGSAQRRYDASARPRYGASAPAPYLLRRPDELISFFDGLDLTEPGVVPCPRWRPDGREPEGSAAGTGEAAYCGVARKA